LLLRRPTKRENDAAGQQRLRGELGRLATVDDRLDDLRGEKGEPQPADILLADAITPGELDHRGGPPGQKICKPAMRARHRFEESLINLGRGAAVAPNDELFFDPASPDLHGYLTRDRQSRAIGSGAVG